MADNIQIPTDLTQVVKVEVKDTSETLRRFLTDMANKINKLEDRVAELENGN